MTISRSPGVVIMSGSGIVIALLFRVQLVGFVDGGLQNFEQRIEPLVTLLPELPVILKPIGRLSHRRRLDLHRPAGGVAAAGDEAGALEDLQMFRYGGVAARERVGQVLYPRLPPHYALTTVS